MSAFEQPRNETLGANPPPPAFNDAVYADIFNSAPKPTAEDLEKSRVAKEQMEGSFGFEMNSEKKADQTARAERLSKDKKAANELLEEIKKAA